MNWQSIVSDVRRSEPAAVALVFAAGCAATIAGFLFFQYGMGLPPCPLCYEQRYAFYLGLALSAMLAFGANNGASRKVMIVGFGALAAMMLWNAGLGVYHAGIEWKFWAGPSDCSGNLAPLGGAGGLLKQLEVTRVIRCDEAAWRLFGISLPGWNVLVSLGHAALAAWGSLGAVRRRR